MKWFVFEVNGYQYLLKDTDWIGGGTCTSMRNVTTFALVNSDDSFLHPRGLGLESLDEPLIESYTECPGAPGMACGCGYWKGDLKISPAPAPPHRPPYYFKLTVNPKKVHGTAPAPETFEKLIFDRTIN